MAKVKDKAYYKKKYVLGAKEIFVKTMILRVVSSMITAILVFVVTGSWIASGNVMWIDFIIKTILYYVYEYEWFKLRSKWRK